MFAGLVLGVVLGCSGGGPGAAIPGRALPDAPGPAPSASAPPAAPPPATATAPTAEPDARCAGPVTPATPGLTGPVKVDPVEVDLAGLGCSCLVFRPDSHPLASLFAQEYGAPTACAHLDGQERVLAVAPDAAANGPPTHLVGGGYDVRLGWGNAKPCPFPEECESTGYTVDVSVSRDGASPTSFSVQGECGC